VAPQGVAWDQGKTLRTPSGWPKGRLRGLGRRRSGGERRCRKAATKPLEIPRVTTLILNPGRKSRVRPPARVAGIGAVETRKLGRLPGENPGTEARNARAEVEANRSLEWSLGTLLFSVRACSRASAGRAASSESEIRSKSGAHRTSYAAVCLRVTAKSGDTEPPPRICRPTACALAL
jgi:hypothetical protein